MSTSIPRSAVDLSGKVALITGAASGIGRAETKLFAAAGARIAAVDMDVKGLRDVVGEVEASGGTVIGLEADLTNLDQIKHVVQRTLQHFDRIDILSNTAGLLDGYTRSLDTSEELWDRIFAVNVKSVFRLTNVVLPGMLAQGQGIIINVSSVAGTIAGGGGAAYTSSKHALIGYTRQLSYDYGRKGIRANALCPGMIETGMTRDVLIDEESKLVKAVKSVPAGRYGQPEDVAEVALFLASDGARFMHGAAVMVDGGLTVK
jgi:3-oxoacyl-[acyl-carrier protein] reductase